MNDLLMAIRMEGWRRGIRWWLWGRKRSVRCPYCVGLSDFDWLAVCDCFKAEDEVGDARRFGS